MCNKIASPIIIPLKSGFRNLAHAKGMKGAHYVGSAQPPQCIWKSKQRTKQSSGSPVDPIAPKYVHINPLYIGNNNSIEIARLTHS